MHESKKTWARALARKEQTREWINYPMTLYNASKRICTRAQEGGGVFSTDLRFKMQGEMRFQQ